MNPSMGPQHESCGKPPVLPTALGEIGLQWGRNMRVAESIEWTEAVRVLKGLQWGRNMRVAESRNVAYTGSQRTAFNGAAT